MKILNLLTLVVAITGTPFFSSAASAAETARFTIIIYDTTGNPFWSKVVADRSVVLSHRRKVNDVAKSDTSIEELTAVIVPQEGGKR
jgi:hypothetical protein